MCVDCNADIERLEMEAIALGNMSFFSVHSLHASS